MIVEELRWMIVPLVALVLLIIGFVAKLQAGGETGVDFLNSLLEEETAKCSEQDQAMSADDVKNVIREVVNENNDYLPYELVAAVAWQESSYQQCDAQGNVLSNEDSFGVMQVNEKTVRDLCKDLDITRLRDNVRCGFKILKTYYDSYKDASKFREKVKKYCKDAYYQTRYLSYASAPGKESYYQRALRAYNGFGCSEGANVNYVEEVLEKRNALKRGA